MEHTKTMSNLISRLDSDLFKFQNLCTAFRHTALSMRTNHNPDGAPAWAGLFEVLREDVLPPLEVSASDVTKEIKNLPATARPDMDKLLETSDWLQGQINTIRNLLVVFDMASTDEDEGRYGEKVDWTVVFTTLLGIATKIEVLSEDIWALVKAEKGVSSGNVQAVAAQG